MPICANCGQDNPDIAKFCLACAAPLAPPAPTTEERKLVTVLFTDIVGSTAKAENMDPEDVRARLAPYYVRLRAELEHFGGTVEKFIGDAVVALFGAPVAHEDDPERAVCAAFAVCRAIDELNAEDEWFDLQVRVGVNTGEALVVVGARASEGEGVASGDVMNTAARLQSAAPIDGILVGELTYGEGITYWPVTDVVKSAAGILQSDDRETIAGKLDGFLETLATEDLDELRTIAAALSNLIGIPTTPRGTYATAEISQGELHWGIRRMLQLLASQKPTALIVEDLHWAEPTLLELIAYIAADETESPLAIVCSTRPELAETSPGFLGTEGRRRTIELGTLDREQGKALLADLLGDPSLAETRFASSLIANAGGKPPFPEGTGPM